MTRAELDQMIERLSTSQAAQLERRRYRRRGAERLPGARGGVCQQKTTDPERILAIIRYQRRVCTRQALAELFDVSPRTIDNALVEVRPLLDQDDYLPIPVPGPRCSTAACSSPLSCRPTHRAPRNHRVDSLRLHYAANLMSSTPKASWPWVQALLHSVYDQPDTASVHAQFDRIRAHRGGAARVAVSRLNLTGKW